MNKRAKILGTAKPLLKIAVTFRLNFFTEGLARQNNKLKLQIRITT
jgi:hypothetical protein